MKTCFKCRESKSLDAFYKHPMMGDGHLNKCKECTKRDAKAVRLANLEHYRSYDRYRASMPHRRTLAKRVQQEWRALNPQRRAAQVMLGNAIRAGKIRPLPCLVCGEKAEGHHTHYDAPLEVVWLCSAHHKQAHAMARAA
jgi:hypothetical protein